MDQIQKSRRNAIIKRDAVLVGIGILYYIFIRVTGLAIPCVFRLITGFKCPGCGITSAVLSCARLDFAGAFRHNRYIPVAAPVIIYLLVRSDYLYIKNGKAKLSLVENILLYACIVGAVLFAVLRNIWNF